MCKVWRTAAIVISFNSPKDLGNTVAALTTEVDKVFVVDNGSSPNNINEILILQRFHGFECIFMKENSGIGHALNVALSRALFEGFDWVLTMDQDSTFKSGFLRSFYECAERTGQKVLSANISGKDMVSCDRFVDLAITSGNMVHMSVFDKVGKFNEWLFIDGVDFEFSFRLKKYSMSIVKVSGAVLEHKLGDRDVRWLRRFHSFHSPLRRYYIFRNHLYLVSLYGRDFPWVLAKISVSRFLYLGTILIFGKDRRKSFRAIFNGVLDFFKGVTGRQKSAYGQSTKGGFSE